MASVDAREALDSDAEGVEEHLGVYKLVGFVKVATKTKIDEADIDFRR